MTPASQFGRSLIVPLILVCSFPASASAQEMVQTFRDPAFGGNPFNGDYLLAIANLSRPDAPEDPVVTPSDEELLAAQIKAQLSSGATQTILAAIQNAKVGQSGTFNLGDQTISYSKTASGTRVVFKNNTTGKESEIFIPAPGSTGSGTSGGLAASDLASALGNASAEQLLSGSAELTAPLLGLPPL